MDSQVGEAEPEDSTNLVTGEPPAEAGQDAPVVPGSFVQCPRCLMQRCFAFSSCPQVRRQMQKQQGES
jgi:uncharacterized protein YcgI (DUF1989 family)